MARLQEQQRQDAAAEAAKEFMARQGAREMNQFQKQLNQQIRQHATDVLAKADAALQGRGTAAFPSLDDNDVPASVTEDSMDAKQPTYKKKTAKKRLSKRKPPKSMVITCTGVREPTHSQLAANTFHKGGHPPLASSTETCTTDLARRHPPVSFEEAERL
jgi:hypothetical protein